MLAIGGPAHWALQVGKAPACITAAAALSTALAAQISVVMKFGGSSLASAERMREVADIVCSFGDQYPCVVLSAMGKVYHVTLQGQGRGQVGAGDILI